MQTRSFKSAIEKSMKTMKEAQKKKSHGPYRPILKDAAWPTDAEGSHIHAPCGIRRKYHPSPLQKKKKFLLFLGPPSYMRVYMSIRARTSFLQIGGCMPLVVHKI